MYALCISQINFHEKVWHSSVLMWNKCTSCTLNNAHASSLCILIACNVRAGYTIPASGLYCLFAGGLVVEEHTSGVSLVAGLADLNRADINHWCKSRLKPNDFFVKKSSDLNYSCLFTNTLLGMNKQYWTQAHAPFEVIPVFICFIHWLWVWERLDTQSWVAPH